MVFPKKVIKGEKRNLLFKIIIRAFLLSIVFSMSVGLLIDKRNSEYELAYGMEYLDAFSYRDIKQVSPIVPAVAAVLQEVVKQNEVYSENGIGITEDITPVAETPPEFIMYLTFDDGPRKDTTPIVLDILKEFDVKATFFLVGPNVENNPDLARRIVEEGHSIGVHCYDHTYKNIYQSVDAYIRDFEKAVRVIEEVTGVHPKIYRFPGGSVNSYNRNVYQGIIQEMEKRGYVYFDWNATIDDTVSGKKTKEILLKNAIRTINDKKRVVLLAHDTVPLTVESLWDLLDMYRKYEYRVLDETVEPVTFRR